MTDPVGIPEIAVRLGVKRETVDQWRHRKLLPSPRWTVGGSPAWEWSAIEAWARATHRLRDDTAHVTAGGGERSD